MTEDIASGWNGWKYDGIFYVKEVEHKGHRIVARYRLGMVEGSYVWEVELDGKDVKRGDSYAGPDFARIAAGDVLVGTIMKIDKEERAKS